MNNELVNVPITARIEEPHPEADQPTKLGRWLLAALLFISYLPLQIVLAIPFLLAYMAFQGPSFSIQALQESEFAIWATLIAAALAAVVTIAAALLWPHIWRRLTSRKWDLAAWLAWQKPEGFSMWMVPVMTLPMLIVVGVGVSFFAGPAEIDVQMMLFSTPALSIASSLVVATVVPVAEEFIFRGALYSALLSTSKKDRPAWRRHAVPFVVTSILFAVVHLFSGAVTFAALLQIFLLSCFLTALRAVSGSVKASMLAHLIWNVAAAIMMALYAFGVGG